MTETSPNAMLAAEQAAGLRALADLIENTPDLAQSAAYVKDMDVWTTSDPEVVGVLARAGAQHGAKVHEDYSGGMFSLRLQWGPVGASLMGYRNRVCELVVTGTETVTKKIQDPAKLAEVPEIEVTEEVDVVEWKCLPLLASGATTQSQET